MLRFGSALRLSAQPPAPRLELVPLFGRRRQVLGRGVHWLASLGGPQRVTAGQLLAGADCTQVLPSHLPNPPLMLVAIDVAFRRAVRKPGQRKEAAVSKSAKPVKQTEAAGSVEHVPVRTASNGGTPVWRAQQAAVGPSLRPRKRNSLAAAAAHAEGPHKRQRLHAGRAGPPTSMTPATRFMSTALPPRQLNQPPPLRSDDGAAEWRTPPSSAASWLPDDRRRLRDLGTRAAQAAFQLQPQSQFQSAPADPVGASAAGAVAQGSRKQSRLSLAPRGLRSSRTAAARQRAERVMCWHLCSWDVVGGVKLEVAAPPQSATGRTQRPGTATASSNSDDPGHPLPRSPNPLGSVFAVLAGALRSDPSAATGAGRRNPARHMQPADTATPHPAASANGGAPVPATVPGPLDGVDVSSLLAAVLTHASRTQQHKEGDQQQQGDSSVNTHTPMLVASDEVSIPGAAADDMGVSAHAISPDTSAPAVADSRESCGAVQAVVCASRGPISSHVALCHLAESSLHDGYVDTHRARWFAIPVGS